MSKDSSQTKSSGLSNDEESFSAKHKPWSYPDSSTNVPQSQNRTCCSPVDDIEAMRNKDENLNTTHSVEVQTDKSTLLLLKQDKKNDNISKKTHTQISNNREPFDGKKENWPDYMNLGRCQTNEFENIKLRKTGFNFEDEKLTAKLAAKINTPEAFDEYTETDDQPMDYTLCYNESNLEEEKKENPSFLPKTDYFCIEETIEEEKVEPIKPKGAFSKDTTKSKKEMFSNTSRSFREIFNFFKDRDKKRSTENSKASNLEGSKVTKTIEISEQKLEKSSSSTQPHTEQYEKEMKSKSEAQCSQQTPLMFSPSSSLGSLNGFEQNSINDDRSSIISDFSRRTSGVVSPSELPDSPAQTALSASKLQQKSHVGCFGKKKIQLPQQDKSKVCQYPSTSHDNSSLTNENNFKKPLASKRSVFEDNLTSFKDESTPTKLHSIAASSLSSLTIDDDDDYELINKIILNKEKQNVIEVTEIQSDRQEPIGESNNTDSLSKTEKIETLLHQHKEDLTEEENDKLTDLTPYEEQLLDELIRRGIAKWTKRNINQIKPFSWDIGLSCRATRTILTKRIRINSSPDIQNGNISKEKTSKTIINNNCEFENNSQGDNKNCDNHKKYSNEDSEQTGNISNLENSNDRLDESSYYINYEEHLLDQCIRRGMAKITKRNMDDIKPFSWDTKKICLTTRAMVRHGHDGDIHNNHKIF